MLDKAMAPPTSPLSGLRSFLSEAGLDGFVIWRDDMFMGEEVRACDERLAMVSGFTGSAGYALILADSAVVFSDGRYHLQLEKQLDSTNWQWRDSSKDAIADYLSQSAADKPLTIGFDATTTSVAKFETLPQKAGEAPIHWQGVSDNPLDALWDERPAHQRSLAYSLPDETTGQSAAEKVQNLQKHLSELGRDGVIVTAVDCVNWLFNIRGDDLRNTPFHLCFAYVPQNAEPYLIEGASAAHDTLSWQAFCDQLEAGHYSFDGTTMPMALYQALSRDGIDLTNEPCQLYLPKARKNETELAGFRRAHRTDGLALCRFWFWLEQSCDLSAFQETDLVALLQAERRKDDSYLCDSFDTIMGSGANGAIIHYRAIQGKDSAIENDNLLLIDSGAHYTTGTTDITRTFAIGTPDDEMIAAYSAVLAGHIALAMAQFPDGTNGAAIDAICRAPLWARGRDYAHGTGHGVGHLLSVHEGPAHIAKRPGPALEQGMVLSNEPGFYAAGKWGIRLENLVAVRRQSDGFLAFETLSLVPFEQRLIDKDILGPAACQWLDSYHATVFETLAPLLANDVSRHWLSQKCAPLL